METEILIALIGRMVDRRLADLPEHVVSGGRGPRGPVGPQGKDFVFAEHEEKIREWSKQFALTFENLTPEQIELLKGPRGRDGRDGKDGKDFVFTEHEGVMRDWAKEVSLTFEDLSHDQIESLRGPRGHDGRIGLDGRSFIFEEHRDAIESTIRSVVDGLRSDLRLKFTDLTADEIGELRGQRGRDGRDGRDFVFDEHREFFNSLRLKFEDLTAEEKQSLKLHFSELTEEEKALLKLRFEDLTDDDKISLRGPRGLRGQKGSQGRDGKNGVAIRGLPGPHGVRGFAGAPGADGKDGTDGVDAPYIVDIQAEQFGKDKLVFCFYFSDGSEIRTDKVSLPAPVNVYGGGGRGGSSSGGRKVDYEIIVDEATDDTTYVGYALPGYATSDAFWKIKRIQVVGTETIIEYAGSNALFDKIWDNRAGYTYG